MSVHEPVRLTTFENGVLVTGGQGADSFALTIRVTRGSVAIEVARGDQKTPAIVVAPDTFDRILGAVIGKLDPRFLQRLCRPYELSEGAHKVLERLSNLKGPPPPLVRWDWSDLPEYALHLKAVLDAALAWDEAPGDRELCIELSDRCGDYRSFYRARRKELE